MLAADVGLGLGGMRAAYTIPTTLAVVGLLVSQPCEHRREDVGNRVLRTPVSPETRVIVIIIVIPLASF